MRPVRQMIARGGINPVVTVRIQRPARMLEHRFAQLATELTQARLLVRHVAQLTDEDPSRMLPKEASMAKLACTELAKKCALEGMQSMGGYGYATEYPMEQYLRAAVVTTIFGGTSEIQKNIIAKTLGL